MKNSSKNNIEAGKSVSPKKFNRNSDGFIEIIVVIIIALVVLHLLGINLSDLLSKQWVKDFAIYIRDILKLVWDDILQIVAFIKGLNH